jgi:hypothetical protein
MWLLIQYIHQKWASVAHRSSLDRQCQKKTFPMNGFQAKVAQVKNIWGPMSKWIGQLVRVLEQKN